MTSRTRTRLDRLENNTAPAGRVHIVWGNDPEDLERKLETHEASGVVGPRDVVHGVRWMTEGEAAARGVVHG
jgi:hypothetical protein